MAIDKSILPNVDKSEPAKYPAGRVKDDDGTGNGFILNNASTSDIFEYFGKLIRLADIAFNGQPDNEQNGYQFVEATKALAGKNDFRYDLGSTTTVNLDNSLNIGSLTLQGLALQIMKPGEVVYALANTGFNGEQTITGSKLNYSKNIVASDPFSQNDLLLVVNSDAGIRILMVVTAATLLRVALAAGFLRAGTDQNEKDGISRSVATTPAANLAAFTDRVNGQDSASFLATVFVNGLMSKEDKIKLRDLADPVKNRGWVAGVDPGGIPTGTSLPIGGDAAQAIGQSTQQLNGNESVIKVTLKNPMQNTNYMVRMFIESQGSVAFDNDACAPVFKPIDVSNFLMVVEESNSPAGSVGQSWKVHFEVVQY